MDDNSIIPFGKFKGNKLGDVSDGYLLGLWDSKKLPAEFKDYVENRVAMLRTLKEKRERESGENQA